MQQFLLGIIGANRLKIAFCTLVVKGLITRHLSKPEILVIKLNPTDAEATDECELH